MLSDRAQMRCLLLAEYLRSPQGIGCASSHVKLAGLILLPKVPGNKWTVRDPPVAPSLVALVRPAPPPILLQTEVRCQRHHLVWSEHNTRSELSPAKRLTRADC